MSPLFQNLIGLYVTVAFFAALRATRTSMIGVERAISYNSLFVQVIIVVHMIGCGLHASLHLFPLSYFGFLTDFLTNLSFFFREAGYALFYFVGPTGSTVGGALTEYAVICFFLGLSIKRKCFSVMSLLVFWLGVLLSSTSQRISLNPKSFVADNSRSFFWHRLLKEQGLTEWAPHMSLMTLYWSSALLTAGCCFYAYWASRPAFENAERMEGSSGVVGDFAAEKKEASFLSRLRLLFQRRISLFFFKPADRRADLFDLTFMLLIQMTEGKGEVSEREVSALERFARKTLNLPEGKLEQLLQTIRTTRRSTEDLRDSAAKLYEAVDGNAMLLESIFDSILAIAHAETIFTIRERALFDSAGRVCKLSKEQLSRIQERYRVKQSKAEQAKRSKENAWREQKQNGSSANGKKKRAEHSRSSNGSAVYKVLGASQTEPFASIKKKYRKLVKERHPDIVLAKGAPEELRPTIEARFREVQSAYEEVCRLRGEG